MNLDQVKQLDDQYYFTLFTRAPLLVARGEGMYVWNDAGRRYLDFCSGGRAVNALGHCHPKVVAAIVQQAGVLLHTSNDYYTEPQARLAELLVTHSAMDRVMFCNSGAEANETAIKLARKYGKRNGGARTEIVTAWNSFHGRTLGALSATGQPKYQQSFTPMVPDFTHVEFNNLAAMDAAITDRTCAVMLEPVMGESGVYAATPEYLAGVRRLCDERDVLLMLDEVQTGLGRTGKLFAYEHFGIEPDVLALSKALGGGMPIGALLAKEHVAIFERGDHGTTFGGTAIAAAAALAAVTAILEEELPANAARIGAQLSTRFAELKAGNNLVSDFRVCGCMAAIDLAAPVAAQVRVMAQDLGLLILTVGDSMLRLLPALICTPEQADDAVQIISKALEACAVPAG